MKRPVVLWMILSGIVLAGCGGLQEVWEGPVDESFHPSSIAVLPPIVGPFEGARELAHEVVTKALKKSNRYTVVIEPEQVNGTLTNSTELRDTLNGYLSALETVGLPNTEAASKLGQALKTDALLVVKVNAWEYTRSEGDKLAKAR